MPFNADEAVVALMAKHILRGERPIFFYGQAYMGSLDAWLVSLGFKAFGQEVWVIRLVQILLYIATMITTYWLAVRLFRTHRAAWATVWLMAIPPVNVVLYTTVSLGGYGEALLLGNLTVLWGLLLEEKFQSEKRGITWWEWIVLGVIAGFGVWVFGLTLIYTIPVFARLMWHQSRRMTSQDKSTLTSNQTPLATYSALWLREFVIPLFSTLSGMILGAFPWIFYGASHGLVTLFGELFGGAISGVESGSWLTQIGAHLINFLLLGIPVILGFRPPWEVQWLVLPLLPFSLFFWILMLRYYVRERERLTTTTFGVPLLYGVLLTGVFGFVLSPYGADPSGRYFLPLYIPLALLAGNFISHLSIQNKTGSVIVAVAVLTYHLGGVLQSAFRYPPGITTQFYAPARVDHRRMQELIDFLHASGEERGYTNYWVAYPLAFLSDERLIFIPRLPYHPDFRYTERDDRYPPYDDMVDQAQRVAYIVTHHPDLEHKLRQEFLILGVTWKETQIGDYHIFYDLSRVVKPEEMGLGRSWP